MRYIQKLHKIIHGHTKREIFVWGFYVSFLLVMTLALILDSTFGHDQDTGIEITFIVLTLLSLGYYLATHNLKTAIYSIVLIAISTTYALLWNNTDYLSAFHSIAPLGFFLLFSLKRSLLYTLMHHTVILGILIHKYRTIPEPSVFQDPAALISIGLTSLMVVLFGIVYHIAVENSYRMLERSNHQKELLLKEVHHRVKNNLNIISSMLGLQMLREEETRVREILDKNKHRIKSIALVHEILYKHDDFERIDLHEYLEQLAVTLMDIHDQEVNISVGGDHHLLPFERVLRIGIIANELIVNSIKYALKEPSPAIRMQIDAQKEYYLFRYEDSNTAPVDLSAARRGQSLGLRFIDMMVRQLDADLSIRSDAGLTYTLWIPKNVH